MARRSFPHNLLFILLLTLIIVLAVLWWTKLNWQCRVNRAVKMVNYGSKELEARMLQRRSRVGSLCKSWAVEQPQEGCVFKSKEGIANQRIGQNFLQDPHTGTLYCYAHKVCSEIYLTGSSTQRNCRWPPLHGCRFSPKLKAIPDSSPSWRRTGAGTGWPTESQLLLQR